MYNLDVGEHYYSPMTTYLDSERGTRGETPGALTFDERLARKWLHGRRYEATELRERYSRASSMARGEASNSYLEAEMAARSARAASEMRTASTRMQSSATASTRMQSSATASREQMIASSMQSSSSARRTAASQQTVMSRLRERRI